MENQSENKPFTFNIKIKLNRNKVAVRKFNNIGGGPAYIDDFSTTSKK